MRQQGAFVKPAHECGGLVEKRACGFTLTELL
jgi:hypothetical protein